PRGLAALLLLASLPAFALSATAPAAAPDKPHDYRDKNFDYFVSGDPRLPRAQHTEFGLALMGGGGSVDAAYRFIASHGGGGHMVVLRAVHDDSFDPEDGGIGQDFVKKWGPVVSAETIVFHNREASSDPRVLKALREADGIFLAGGDQANYVRYWKGTAVQDLLNEHVRANRPIGGSSAGLAILGHYSYTAYDGGSMESKVALANPFDSGVTLEGDFLHYRYLDSVITDTHFGRRSRLGRLITFLARLRADHPDQNLFGIGVDEKTALLIGADGVGTLAQGSAGSAWIVMPQKPASVLVAGKPLSLPDLRLVRLDAKSRIDLTSRKIDQPGAEATISIENGKLTGESIATKIIQREVVPDKES
ncbi:MAG TPA: cyanophycinase, partial [Rudaea sp.]